MEKLEVNSELTRAQSVHMYVRAESLHRVVDDHEAALDRLGPRPWGEGDQVARSFEKAYLPASRELIRACRELAKGITSTADSVSEAMKGFEHVEKGNAGLAGRVPSAPAGSPVPPASA